MKFVIFFLVFFLVLFSCVSDNNSPDFIKKATGRYLFNANETIDIYFKDAALLAKWRGRENIKPLKLSDSSFYFKELNEKMVFVEHPEFHIKLTEKKEHDGVRYLFRKLEKDEKTPIEYLENNLFEKALTSYQNIQKKDSLNPVINQRTINRMGYKYVRAKEYEKAINLFKINAVLYPKSDNVYDSLGEAYLKNKDTINATKNFEKALVLNKNNRNAQRNLKRVYKE